MLARVTAALALVLVMAAGADAQTRRGTVTASAEILAPIEVTRFATIAEPDAAGALTVTTELGIGAPVPHAVRVLVRETASEGHRSAAERSRVVERASSPPPGTAQESSGSRPSQGVERYAVGLGVGGTEYRVTFVVAAVL